MSKMSEMDATIKELRDVASSINDIANWLTEMFSNNGSDSEDESATAKEPPLTFEQVRAILADKSRDGFTEQVRELLQKYGAKKLSEINPDNYKAIVAEAEVLKNA